MDRRAPQRVSNRLIDNDPAQQVDRLRGVDLAEGVAGLVPGGDRRALVGLVDPHLLRLVDGHRLEHVQLRIDRDDARRTVEDGLEGRRLLEDVDGERVRPAVGLDIDRQHEAEGRRALVDVLRLLDSHLQPAGLAVVADVHLELGRARPVAPLLEEPLQAESRDLLHDVPHVVCLHGVESVAGHELLEGREEDLVSHHHPQHVQDRRALRVGVGRPPKHLPGVLVDRRDHAELVGRLVTAGDPVTAPDRVEVAVLPVAVLRPECPTVGREAFIDPDVRPALAGEEVARPLVRELMGDQALHVAVGDGHVVQNRRRVHRGGRRVLHAAGAEVLDQDLVVAGPWIGHSEALLEDVDHLAGHAVSGHDLVGEPLGHPHLHRDAVVWNRDDVVLADRQDHQVIHVRLVLEVVPDGAASVIGRGHEPAVAAHGEPRGHVHDQLGRKLLVGRVVAGKPVAVELRLAVRVDLGRVVRGLGERRREDHPCVGVAAAVLDHDLVGRRRRQRRVEAQREGLVVRVELDGGALQRDRIDVEPDGVKRHGRDRAADGREPQRLGGREAAVVQVFEAHLQLHVLVVDDPVRRVVARVAAGGLVVGLGAEAGPLQLAGQAGVPLAMIGAFAGESGRCRNQRRKKPGDDEAKRS